MATTPATTLTDSNDPLIPSSVYRRELGDISLETEWRWRQRGILGEPLKIAGRNYRLRSEIEAFKKRLTDREG